MCAVVGLLFPSQNTTGNVSDRPSKLMWLTIVETRKSKIEGVNLMRASLAVSWDGKAEAGWTKEERAHPAACLLTKGHVVS